MRRCSVQLDPAKKKQKSADPGQFGDPGARGLTMRVGYTPSGRLGGLLLDRIRLRNDFELVVPSRDESTEASVLSDRGVSSIPTVTLQALTD